MNSVVALPIVAATPTTLAAIESDADRELEQLGIELEAAWAFENSCYRAIDKLCEEIGIDAQTKILRYRGPKSVDACILRFLGEFVDDCGYVTFTPRDIQDLRGTKISKRADRRVVELCSAHDKQAVLLDSAAFVEAAARSEHASDLTTAIVRRIEATPARSLPGLIVKVKAIRWCRTGDLEDDVSNAATDMRIAQSIIEDVAKMDAAAAT